MKLKKAYDILEDKNLTKEEKDKYLFEKKNLFLKIICQMLDIKIKLPLKTTIDVNQVMTKPWVVGFIEAVGSFYLISNDKTSIVHGFGLIQKLDSIVLEGIRSLQ